MSLGTLDALLAGHRLDGAAESPLPHQGFSGSTLTLLTRADGTAFVLKRMSVDRDWIMAATDDGQCREAQFAAAAPALPASVLTPSLGAARDGDVFALLMTDITPSLIPEGPISSAQLRSIIQCVAALHREGLQATPPPASMLAWCDLTRRLTLLTPATAAVAVAYGAPVAHPIRAGWERFDALATSPAREVIRSLMSDPSPLTRALAALPSAFLHGDLKFDNIGLGDDGRMWLIDWALTLVAPAAVELGWFLAVNSQRIPATLNDVLAMYADAATLNGDLLARHNALTAVCGLLLRGWRKALDADAGEADELRWWCGRVEAAAQYL